MADWNSNRPRNIRTRYHNDDAVVVNLPFGTGTPLPTPLTLASRDANATTCFKNAVISVEDAPAGPITSTLSLTPARPWRQRITDSNYSAVAMPIATTVLYVGQSWKIVNDKGNGTGLNIVDSAGTILDVLTGGLGTTGGNACIVTCLDNTSSAGTWEVERIANAKYAQNGALTAASQSVGFQTVATGATVQIIYDYNPIFCSSVTYDIFTGNATINETGTYEIAAITEFSGIAGVTVAPTSLSVKVKRNGNSLFNAVKERGTGYINRVSLETSSVVPLTAGDVITFTAFQDSGSDAFIGWHQAGSTTDRYGCNMTIKRVQ